MCGPPNYAAALDAAWGFDMMNRKNAVIRIGNSVPPLFMRAIARHIRAEILGAGALEATP